MKRKGKTAPLLCPVLLFAAAGITGVIAYQTDGGNVENRLTPGFNDSQVTEEFPQPDPVFPEEEQILTKKVAVTNVEGVPCFVRVALRVSTSDIPVIFQFEGKDGYHEADWELGEDGYYYYQHVLEEKETTSVLVDGVRIGGEASLEEYLNATEELDILVYAETVQAKNGDTGEYWPSPGEAWKYYLNTPQTRGDTREGSGGMRE